MTVQTSANPNVEVTALDETTSKGQGNYSFDEIANITAKANPVKAEPKVEAKEEPKIDPLAETKEMKEKHENVPSQKQEREADTLQKAVDKNEEKAEKVEKAIKKLVAKYGEEILELNPESKLTHKVDGKDVEVSVQELLNHYSGHVAWDKRFQELDKDKKTWQNKTNEVDKFVTDFFNLAMTPGKAIEAFQMLATATNQDPIKFTRDLRSSILQEHQKYASLTEDERKLLDIQEETHFYDRQRQQKQQEYQREQSHLQVQRDLNAFEGKYNLGQEKTAEIYNTLTQHLVKHGRDPQTLTVKDLETYHVHDIAYTKAEDAIGKLKPDLLDSDEVVDVVAKYVLKDLSVTPEAVESYVASVFGIKPPRKTAEILQEKEPAKKVHGLEKHTDSGKRKPMFFSDLE